MKPMASAGETQHFFSNRKPRELGRPTRFTVGVALKLDEAFSLARNVVQAARQAGAGKSKLYDWIKAGPGGDPRYAELVSYCDEPSRWSVFDV
jgi:hypothetical protein